MFFIVFQVLLVLAPDSEEPAPLVNLVLAALTHVPVLDAEPEPGKDMI